jgi:hypothetical protein
MKKSPLKRLGMAEARLRLPALAAELARSPDKVVEVTRRGKAVLHLVAPPRIEEHATAARRILQRVMALPERPRGAGKDIARQYKRILYGRP